jgi:nucleotide-binding universal stress UspA family protein
MLLCTDFSDHARHASQYALSMAKEYGAELTLLHVLEDTPGSADLHSATEKAVKQLEESIAPKTREECRVKVMVRIGKPYQQIMQLTLEAQTDLVIMGVRGRGALDTALFGSTTYRVIQLGPCPVLAVHIPVASLE